MSFSDNKTMEFDGGWRVHSHAFTYIVRYNENCLFFTQVSFCRSLGSLCTSAIAYSFLESFFFFVCREIRNSCRRTYTSKSWIYSHANRVDCF